MRRALLIANTNAQSFSRYKRDVILKALSAEFDLQEVETTGPGHATPLAAGAAREGLDLVIALGGDGTVNEVANGLAGSGVPMGILPGGGANIFAGAVGIPLDAVEATGFLLERAIGPPHRVPLGRIEGRYFASNCGVGFDAAVVRRVEARQSLKRSAGEPYFVWSAVRVFYTGYDRHTPRVHLSWGQAVEERRDGLFLVMIQNVSPYTFLGRRPMRLCPDATLAGGLDAFAVDTMRSATILRLVLSAFGRARHPRNPHVVVVRDQPRFDIRCDEALWVQVDGEPIGQRSEVVVEAVPEALSVVF